MHIQCTINGKAHNIEATLDWSIMEIIREAGLPISAQCGGSCACSTCHVYVDPAWVARLPEPSEEEVAMLDSAFEVKENSRLACQIFFTKELDGLIVTVANDSVVG